MAAAVGTFGESVVVVLEGAARLGVEEGDIGGVRVLHAPASGDDQLVAVAAEAAGSAGVVTLVSADRALRRRVEAVGARVAGPGWFLGLLDQ